MTHSHFLRALGSVSRELVVRIAGIQANTGATRGRATVPCRASGGDMMTDLPCLQPLCGKLSRWPALEKSGSLRFCAVPSLMTGEGYHCLLLRPSRLQTEPLPVTPGLSSHCVSLLTVETSLCLFTTLQNENLVPSVQISKVSVSVLFMFLYHFYFTTYCDTKPFKL